MLEARIVAIPIRELSSSRIGTKAAQVTRLSRYQARPLSSATRYRVNLQQQRPTTSSSDSLADDVPKAADLAKYAAKIGGRGSLTETYAAYGATEQLWKQCLRQADYTVPNMLKKLAEPAPKNEAEEDVGEGSGLWFTPRAQGGIELPVTFMTWAQVMFLHLYIINARLRRLSAADLRTWQQPLLDFFFQAAEDKMETWHGMAARGIRNKQLKDLWLSWRGCLLSYDEGLINGDAVLAAAVWRSVFRGSVDANVADIALVTAYLRRELQRIDAASSIDINKAAFRFGSLADVSRDIGDNSPRLAEQFTAEDLAVPKQ